MDEAGSKILKMFGDMNRQQLDLHVLFEAAGNEPADRERVLDALEELQREGLVEPRGGDFYSLTEKGKRAAGAQTEMPPH